MKFKELQPLLRKEPDIQICQQIPNSNGFIRIITDSGYANNSDENRLTHEELLNSVSDIDVDYLYSISEMHVNIDGDTDITSRTRVVLKQDSDNPYVETDREFIDGILPSYESYEFDEEYDRTENDRSEWEGYDDDD